MTPIEAFPALQLFGFTGHDFLDDRVIDARQIEQLLIEYADSSGRDCPECQLGLKRRTQFTDDQDIEQRSDRYRHFESDRNTSTRQSEDDRIGQLNSLYFRYEGTPGISTVRVDPVVHCRHEYATEVRLPALRRRTYVRSKHRIARLENRISERLVMRAASKSAANTREPGSVSFDDKVRFLCSPSSYPEYPTQVTLRETNHAWLFMTERHVFKMKKPFRLGGFDFSSLDSRRWLCNEEYRLNRRLAKNTYLGVATVVRNQRGALELDGEGIVVEWLVKMIRLADSQALLEAASQKRAPPEEIRKLMRKLCSFYANSDPVDFAAGAYLTHLRGKLEYWSRELLRSKTALPNRKVKELLRRQLAYIDANSDLLDKRAAAAHIRDGHGDLRPEHIFLVEDAEPEIIDCLEFDPGLRRLDSAEEIAFLAMECRHAGYGSLAQDLYECYRVEFGEAAVPGHLWNFYASLGATVRAGLATWRISGTSAGGRWQRRAGSYFRDALHFISQ